MAEQARIAPSRQGSWPRDDRAHPRPGQRSRRLQRSRRRRHLEHVSSLRLLANHARGLTSVQSVSAGPTLTSRSEMSLWAESGTPSGSSSSSQAPSPEVTRTWSPSDRLVDPDGTRVHPHGGQKHHPDGELQDKQEVQAVSVSEQPRRDRQQGDPQEQTKPSQAELSERTCRRATPYPDLSPADRARPACRPSFGL